MIIDALYNEATDVIDHLRSADEISLALDAERHFNKIFVLSCASYFEKELQTIVKQFVATVSRNDQRLISFVDNKAIAFQYHTYFNWGERNNPDKPGKNANTFLSLFGEEFKKRFADLIQGSPQLEEAIKAFIELGHLRNILVHSNFAAYDNLQRTLLEHRKLFDKAQHFVHVVRNELRLSPHNA